MTDFQKCFGEDCPTREMCWRFVKAPNRIIQAYLKPEDPRNCEHYLPESTTTSMHSMDESEQPHREEDYDG